TGVADPVGPAIAAFAIVVVVEEGPLVVLGVAAQPLLRVLVFLPLRHPVGLQTLPVALVVLPLTDVDIPGGVPLGTTPPLHAVLEIALVGNFLLRQLQLAEAMELAVDESTLVTLQT